MVASKHKHLDFVSSAIARMAQNSFTVRGWCITLVSALLAFSAQSENALVALSALLPVAMFWVLDAYYVQQERGFRMLFDHVRTQDDDKIDYAMTPRHTSKLLSVMFDSQIFFYLYGGLAILICAITWAISSSLITI